MTVCKEWSKIAPIDVSILWDKSMQTEPGLPWRCNAICMLKAGLLPPKEARTWGIDFELGRSKVSSFVNRYICDGYAKGRSGDGCLGEFCTGCSRSTLFNNQDYDDMHGYRRIVTDCMAIINFNNFNPESCHWRYNHGGVLLHSKAADKIMKYNLHDVADSISSCDSVALELIIGYNEDIADRLVKRFGSEVCFNALVGQYRSLRIQNIKVTMQDLHIFVRKYDYFDVNNAFHHGLNTIAEWMMRNGARFNKRLASTIAIYNEQLHRNVEQV